MTRLAALLLLPLAALARAPADPALLPRPVVYQAAAGSLSLCPETRITFAKEIPAFQAAYLAENLRAATGVAVATGQAPGGKGAITLRLEPSLAKGYRLRVSEGSATIEGRDTEAVFHGAQTLIQLAGLGGGKVAGCEILDHARFGWRGLMLDSSRHFQTVEEIKVLLDQMALHKLNVFHWHLTDDQGWRIEIKSRPKLTEVGAWRVPREGIWWFRPGPQKGEKATYGGYYTQEQVREVVAYATARHITVMPEIDVPGHSLAILAAYPELSTTGGPFQVNPGSKFYGTIENTLDPSNPETFRFLEEVFSEVAPLFTSPFIHMGGDECTKVFWKKSPKVRAFMREKGIKDESELQSWFVRQTEAIIRSKGKRLMGWDEILEGGLAEGASVMSWQGKNGGIAAARMGRDVVMSPSPAYYLDLYQGHPEIEPPTYGMARLRDSFLFDPSLPKDIPGERLLGIQGNIWTEEIPNFRHLQYMTWPRAWAIAEEAWSPALDAKAKLAAWPGFVARVERQFGLFDRRGWHYARSMYDPAMSLSKDGKTLTLTAEIPGLDIHYCFDDTEPDATYPKAAGPIAVPLGADAVRTRTYRDGEPVGRLTWVRLQHISRGKRVP